MWQEVDGNDHLLGPLRPEDAAGRIHRRVAVLVYDEAHRGLFWQQDGWDLPSRPVEDEESSEEAAEKLLQEMNLPGPLLAGGGIFLLGDDVSSQTHLFISPWSGREPALVGDSAAWRFFSSPPPGGHYSESSLALLRAMRKGHPASVRMRKDMRSGTV